MQLELITNSIQTSLNEQQNLWFQKALKAIASSDDPIEDLLLYSAMVKRKFTNVIGIDDCLENVSDASELARLVFCRLVITKHSIKPAELIKAYYQGGDSSEKTALLKGLSWIDEQGAGVELAVRAARANSLDEFSALALSNRYPSLHFADLNFNQLVLKALFQGLEIDELVGLKKRLSEQLVNMCFSYVIEQALADRVPPSSIWLAINKAMLSQEHLADFDHYTQHYWQISKLHRQRLQQLFDIQG